MKEKIERLSKGIFEYEMPELLVSEDVLALTVEAGGKLTGSILISNKSAVRMKGILYVTGKMLNLGADHFIGTENEIPYSVNAEYMEQGENFTGFISIVCDCGERQIPYSILVTQPYCESSIGPVRDLFHFANLAKTNWAEATALFASDSFANVMEKNEKKFCNAYRQLRQSPNREQAVEEFLVLIHKKKSCTFDVSERQLRFEVQKENLMEPLILTKRQWGYLRIEVISAAPYLKLSKQYVEKDDFVNGQYELRVEVETESLKPGIHDTELVLKSARQQIVIPVSCKKQGSKEEQRRFHRELKSYEKQMLERYLMFRNNATSSGVYFSESAKLVEAVLRLIDREQGSYPEEQETLYRKRAIYELYHAYLQLADGKNRVNAELLHSLFRRKAEYERTDPLLYGSVLYLEAMWQKNRDLTDSYAELLREKRKQAPEEFMLYWFLMYMDRRLEENGALRLEGIRQQCDKGCNSPILYYEAAAIWMMEPLVIKQSDGFSCRVMSYMIKSGLVTRETALQFAYLSERSSAKEELVVLLLMRLYKMFPHKDILTVLCQKLVRLGKREHSCHVYYRMGIQAQIRVDGLYEAYLYSMDKEENSEIDPAVLLYFSYANTLPESDTEYLYSAVVRNKDSNPAIYRAYLKKMEQFTVNQLKAGRMNSCLAVLYADVLRKSIIDAELAQTLPDLLFSYQLECTNPAMKRVCVAHKEEQEALVLPIQEGKAVLPVYTENAELFLIDEEGNRYLLSEEERLYRLMHGEGFLEACYEMGSRNRKLLLHIWEKNKQYNKYEATLLELQKQMTGLKGLRQEVINDCTVALVDHYYEHYEGELLEAHLDEVNLEYLSASDRGRMLELMILRDMYEKVIDAVKRFGCENLQAKRLARLCIRGIRSGREEQDREILLLMGFYAFRSGRIEDGLLQYLAENYNGTTAEMYDVWTEAKARGMDTMELEERLLGQMLFAESYVENSYAVFSSYYQKGMNRKLIRAYLSYSAYKYFVRERVTAPELFELLKKEPFLENSQICILALLRYYAGKPELSDAEKAFADYHIQKLEQRKQIYAFFSEYEGKIPLPAGIVDKYYMEYRTNPKHKVVIHYSRGESDHFTEEVMEDMGYGIFTKEMILFFGECLQYFITEETGEEQKITESCLIQYSETETDSPATKYGRINEILMTKELKDEKTLIHLLEQYYKTEYAIKRHFTPV